MNINLEYLKELYTKIPKENKQTVDIANFEDFIFYIKDIIVSNIDYDFNLGGDIDINKIFKEE